MGGDGVTGLEVGDGADGFAVLRKETVSHPVDTFGVAGSEALLEEFDAMPANEELSFGCTRQTQCECLNTLGLFVHPVNEPFGDGSRCLEGFVRDEVQDGDVARVPYTREDRQFVLRTNGTEGVVVETGEVGGGTSAADDYNGIVMTACAIRPLCCRNACAVRPLCCRTACAVGSLCCRIACAVRPSFGL